MSYSSGSSDGFDPHDHILPGKPKYGHSTPENKKSSASLPTSDGEKQTVHSTRTLRTRIPKSYAIPFNFEEEEEMNSRLSRLDSEPPALPSSAIAKQTTSFSSHIMFQSNSQFQPRSSRIRISRENRVPTPPPIPKTKVLNYLDPQAFPAWLLGDALVKSSGNFLSCRSPQRGEASSSNIHMSNSQPQRTSGSSILGSSPSKSINQSMPISFNGQNRSRSNLVIRNRSLSPDEIVEKRRESFWSHYEYDETAAHLQSKYYNKPLPLDEYWPDLDIQNVNKLSDPKDILPSNHLFEVFVSSASGRVDRSKSEIRSKLELQRFNNSSSSYLTTEPFGFGFIPHDYSTK
ncbi:hypothetical protein BY996DRAFT_8500126 [Phakopsora pachyrhizi]|uniref:Expressed protein n=1 Tax=Phakopsora pachyrhizi TaxID=170000 RepID=A0AAV0BCG0_PHAPC|nr:hypothetical protein BY996DRAFT_8500126 [Phakopsora pachyrhizi]CAH7685024.1 expressed protein [Phakopsora pachyrhizi]